MNLPSLGFWALHVAGCLVTGALAWGMGAALHRMLRISHAARNYWLGIWLLAVVPTIAAVTMELWAPAQIASLSATLPLPAAIDSDASDAALVAVSPARSALWPSLSLMLAAAYLGGAGVALLRELLGALSVWRIVRAAEVIDPAALSWPATVMEMRRLGQAGITLRLTQRSMTPFAVRWPRPTIVLPVDAFHHLNDRQLHLIVRHEAAHLSERDSERASLMKLVGALLWFNPFVRMIAARVQMAAELHCDALALDGNTAASRDFAAAYLSILRTTACGSGHMPVTALTHRDLDGHKMRIRHMLNGDRGRGIPIWLRTALAVSALASGGLMAVMQIAVATPANSGSSGSAPAASQGNGNVHLSAPAFQFAFPVAAPKITGHFGDSGGVRKRPHRGTDFGARRGTPVFAPTAGLVVAATQQYPDAPNYGTVVVLDHGNGWQTLFAHLDGYDVRAGQRVEAGQQIARVGRTGKVTGSHLHLEMLLNGQRVDPEQFLR